jgi:hypothetical protein
MLEYLTHFALFELAGACVGLAFAWSWDQLSTPRRES